MSNNHRIIFLSFFIVTNVLLADNPQPNGVQSEPSIEPLYPPTAPKDIRDFINKEREQQQNNSSSQQSDFNAMDIKKMNLVFKSSPKEAQCIVNHLQDPTYFSLNEDYRSAIFVGEPGSGKTTMARAIANKMTEHGWEYKIISSTSLLGEQRNHTAIRLKKELDEIEASKKKTILIIDELNLLMENTESKHHDTDATAKTLWMFLDKQSGNKNFFFIGTMNRINKLPKAYKNRVLPDYIEFPLMTESAVKTQFLRDYLTSPNTKLDEEVTNDFLNKEVKKMGDSSGRDLENISRVICRKSKMSETTPSSPLVIKQAAITYAIDEYMRKKRESDYDIEEETDEARQNRFHRENMEMHERQFIQQHKIQMAIHAHQYVDISNNKQNHHFISAEGRQEIDSLISDEQNKLYDDMMKPTHKRKAQEAAIKAALEKAAAEKAAREAEENSIVNQVARFFNGNK